MYVTSTCSPCRCIALIVVGTPYQLLTCLLGALPAFALQNASSSMLLSLSSSLVAG